MKIKQKAGLTNVEFLKGEIENIPLPHESVDVVISNCVINLSANKDRVLQEAFRVLKPGGRFAVSDVIVRGSVPADIRRSVDLWVGCVAGALDESDYRAKLADAGFSEIEIEPTRIYHIEDLRAVPHRPGPCRGRHRSSDRRKIRQRLHPRAQIRCGPMRHRSIVLRAGLLRLPGNCTGIAPWRTATTFFFFAPEIPRDPSWQRPS